jgi:cell division protein FtsI/penicillin-binding protein 2
VNGPIRKVAIAVFIAFAVLLLDITYIQAIAGPGYRDDPRNPRLQIGIAGKERGLILDSGGVRLAQSEALEASRRACSATGDSSRAMQPNCARSGT